jgi:hypothetical protein
MRRSLIVSLVIVAVLAVAVFLGGWVQLTLTPQTVGVLYSRTRGFEKEAALPHGVTWRWERLIPGAFTVYRFPASNRKTELVVRGSLPSGDVYASLAPEKPDFGFELHLTVLYRLDPAALPGLAETQRLRPDGLGDLFQALDEQMKDTALTIISSEPGGDERGLQARIAAGLPARFPQLRFEMVASTVSRMPDLALYDRLRETYLRVTRAREESLAAAAARLAAAEAEQDAAEKRHERSLALLEKYGALLDKHPQLIKFLFLTTAKGFSPSDLQTLDLLGKLEALR